VAKMASSGVGLPAYLRNTRKIKAAFGLPLAAGAACPTGALKRRHWRQPAGPRQSRSRQRRRTGQGVPGQAGGDAHFSILQPQS
jgi:hypothetical protein